MYMPPQESMAKRQGIVDILQGAQQGHNYNSVSSAGKDQEACEKNHNPIQTVISDSRTEVSSLQMVTW